MLKIKNINKLNGYVTKAGILVEVIETEGLETSTYDFMFSKESNVNTYPFVSATMDRTMHVDLGGEYVYKLILTLHKAPSESTQTMQFVSFSNMIDINKFLQAIDEKLYDMELC